MSPADIRVEKGHAEPEEVAAITALLLARAAARPAEIARTGSRPTRTTPSRHSPSSGPTGC